MTTSSINGVHALLFGLSEDLAGELLQPLSRLCSNVQTVKPGKPGQPIASVADSRAEIIFCGADVDVVTQLRGAKPGASIVVVSRHPEITDWLDSIEAGATDYCAAPFETSQVKWIVESSLRAQTVQH